MRFIVEPVYTDACAYCYGCSSNACNSYTNSSGNTDIGVDVKVKVKV